MKKKLVFLFFLLGIFLGCSRSSGEKITILFTNDLQGRAVPYPEKRGGLARIAQVVKEIRAENPNTILLDAGDFSVGSALATHSRGEAIVRIMNAVGYSAGVYGNHEFDLGKEQARRYQEIARFPILACNIRDEQGRAFAPEYAIFQLGSFRLAVVGVANSRTPNLVNPSGISGLSFLPAEAEVRRVQHQLSGKADLIILLTHQGIAEDTKLAYQLKAIPLIIGGHSEIAINGLRKVKGVKIAQAGHFGWWLGRIDFYWHPKEKKASDFKARLIKITKRIPPDPEVEKLILEQEKILPRNIDRVIGRTWRTLSKDYLGYWLAELLKEYTGSDFGIINTGGVRSKIFRGKITPRMIYYVMPFQDRVCKFELSGKKLLRLKPARHLYFSRGPGIEWDRSYQVGSIDFLLKINEFPGAETPVIYPELFRDIIIKQIEQNRGIKFFWAK